MPSSRIVIIVIATIATICILAGFPARLAHGERTPIAGEVRIAQWKDDKKAAFLLMFDDSWPSHWQVAAPELVKRGMIATFYICPGKGEHQRFAQQWDETLWRQGMVYGDHTMTHKGVKNLEGADWEIGECARIIRKITLSNENRLLSYGQPGVGPNDWNITTVELEELLKKHRLISRPTFVDHGAVYHLKTAEEMLALADKAIVSNGMEYVVIHGVERFTPDWGYQDMWPLKQEVFVAFLDGLADRRDKGKLWITDHISMHQYETERNSAEIRVLESDHRRISLTLKSKADPREYDFPLTVVAEVPREWKNTTIRQGNKATVVETRNGFIQFEAVPGPDPITVESEAGADPEFNSPQSPNKANH